MMMITRKCRNPRAALPNNVLWAHKSDPIEFLTAVDFAFVIAQAYPIPVSVITQQRARLFCLNRARAAQTPVMRLVMIFYANAR